MSDFLKPLENSVLAVNDWELLEGASARFYCEVSPSTKFTRVRGGDKDKKLPYHGAVVVAVNEKDEFCFVKIDRITLGRVMWELPRGGCDDEDVSLVETGLRELEEETGFVSDKGVMIGVVWADSGLIFDPVAVVLVKVDEKTRINEETDGEVSSVEWWSREKILSEIFSGRISDAISIAAIGKYLGYKNSEE